jgi:spore maturation protein A
MLNLIWMLLLVGGVVAAALSGNAAAVTDAAFASARQGVTTLLELAGLMALWMGLTRVAEKAGLMEGLAKLLRPLVVRLFPSLPPKHPAVGSMLMNMSANMLGLGSAATPLGLKAMQELQAANKGDKETASEAMCTFLTLNTCSITLVPGTIIAIRAAAGSMHPADIVAPTLVATVAAGLFGITVDALVRRWNRRRYR